MSYRKYKLIDFNKKSFIVDIMSFLTQNFNPINLDRKLDQENKRDLVKFLWDECNPHEFVRYIYTSKNYDVISNPNLTYQKANEIVANYFLEYLIRINRAVHKYEQKPIGFKIGNSEQPTMVNINENVQKKRVEKRKMLEKQLSENTIKMKKLKSNKL